MEISKGMYVRTHQGIAKIVEKPNISDRKVIYVDKNVNYQFWTDKSRNGYMSYALAQLNPYKEIYPNNNRYCRSLWQCIKEYIRIIGDNK